MFDKKLLEVTSTLRSISMAEILCKGFEDFRISKFELPYFRLEEEEKKDW